MLSYILIIHSIIVYPTLSSYTWAYINPNNTCTQSALARAHILKTEPTQINNQIDRLTIIKP